MVSEETASLPPPDSVLASLFALVSDPTDEQRRSVNCERMRGRETVCRSLMSLKYTSEKSLLR